MAPMAFEKCVLNGGRVVTKKINENDYIHICYKNGKSFSGEVKHKKKPEVFDNVKGK